jgi:ppGpp synthetase/RelA/SpoT-type nucleotidyltranferase
MATLNQLVLEHRETIEEYARRVKGVLENVVRARASSIPVYAIKTRVKTWPSLERNWRKESRSFDGLSGIAEVFKVVRDLVGARIVFQFRSEVEDAAKYMSQAARHHGVKLLGKDWDRIEWGPWWNDDEERAVVDRKASVRASGYTSFHRDVELIDPIGGFDGFRFELQMRTLMEEAWAEPNHTLVYKKYKSPETGRLFVLMKQQLKAADDLLQHVADKSMKERQARESVHNIQVSKTYTYDGSGLSEAQRSMLQKAHEFRRAEQHDDAISQFEAILKTLNPSTDAFAAVQLELALDVLLKGGEDYLQKAERIYQPCLGMSRPIDFWASFRMSLIRHEQGISTEAIRRCTHALNILVSEEYDGEIPHYSCNGLEADVRTWLGVLYFRLAKSDTAYFKRCKESAIEQTEQALRLLKKDKTTAVAGIRDRALNNLAYYHLTRKERAGIEKARSYLYRIPFLKVKTPLKRVPVSISNAYILTTLAELNCYEAEIERSPSRRREKLAAAEKAINVTQDMVSSIKRHRNVPLSLERAAMENVQDLIHEVSRTKAAKR